MQNHQGKRPARRPSGYPYADGAPRSDIRERGEQTQRPHIPTDRQTTPRGGYDPRKPHGNTTVNMGRGAGSTPNRNPHVSAGGQGIRTGANPGGGATPNRNPSGSAGGQGTRTGANPGGGGNSYAGRSRSANSAGRQTPQRPRMTAAEEKFQREKAEFLRREREKAAIEEARRIAEYERRRLAAKAERRRLEAQIKKENKIRRKRERKIFMGRALVAVIISAILFVVASIGLILHFSSAPDSPKSSITYTFGGKEVRVVDGDTAQRGSKTYVCFTDVANYLGLATTGSTDSMKYVFADTDFDSEGGEGEDSVVFMMDSRTVAINSQVMTLPAESFIYGEEVWVCTEFIADFMTGITVERDGNTVAVSRLVDEESSTKTETVYLPVSLKLKEAVPSPDTTEDEDEGKTDVNLEVTFQTDLKDYEKYMDPKDAEEYLILVNTASTLDATFAPTDLVEVAATRQDGREAQLLRKCAAKALEALFIEMEAAGYTDVSVMSGYRSYESQDGLHNYYIDEEMSADPTLTWEDAQAIVLTYSAAAGTSEHQTGLCVDMHNLPSATTEFAAEEAYTWLTENAWKFGFILRFPEGKTSFTGISFEPWHWRFVGRTAAAEIYSEGICLEEYISSLNV